MNKKMYVYIMANNRPTLYTGVTNNLIRRVYEHKQELIEGFTKKYHLHKLIYYQQVDGQLQTIIREKQIKSLNRIDKLQLIQKFNPEFEDLYPIVTEDSGQARMTNPTAVILGSEATPESKQRKDSGQARMTGSGADA